MFKDLKKKPHENERQYIWRISEAKNSGLLDMSWPQVAELFNQELRGADEKWRNESAYRKPYQEAKAYYEDVFSEMKGEEYLSDLLAQKRELEKLKAQVQTEKLEYNRWIRESSRDELIMEKISESVRSLPALPVVDYIENGAEYNYQGLRLSSTERSCVLAFGDAHFGVEFDIKGLLGETINSYSPEIFYRRMNNLLYKTIEFVQDNGFDHIYVYDMGDSIDGILRVGQLMKLRYGVVDSAILYAEFLANWFNTLTRYCSVDFQIIGGNHSEIRHLGQKKGSFEEDNMSKVIAEFIRIRLEKNHRFKMKINDSGMIFEKINGFNLVGIHGDSKKLDAKLKDLSLTYNINIDILMSGHKHHSLNEAVGINTDIVSVPSIMGTDNYSMELCKSASAGATIFVIDSAQGKLLDYHIKFSPTLRIDKQNEKGSLMC